jgi:hypothetical protein
MISFTEEKYNGYDDHETEDDNEYGNYLPFN